MTSRAVFLIALFGCSPGTDASPQDTEAPTDSSGAGPQASSASGSSASASSSDDDPSTNTSGSSSSSDDDSDAASETADDEPPDIPEDIADLEPGQWFEIPRSTMDAVVHDVDGPDMWDVSCVISCWCGGAYDSDRDRLVVWGGGHGQYSGNELYAFSLESLAWERLDDPSNPPGVDVPYAPDGRPTSRHTYGYLQYVPTIDRFCTFGGAAFYTSGQTGTDLVDCFDFDSATWETSVSIVPSGGNGYAFSAVDPLHGFVYQHGPGGSSQLVRFRAADNTWSTITVTGTPYIGSAFDATAAFDPQRQQLVAVGNGITIWDVDPESTNATATQPTTSGAAALEGAYAPGFDYDPVSETMIGWDGGQTIYALDLDTLAWTHVAGAGADPGPANANGTYGRFRYVPSMNVFVVVSASDGNVFVYRHTADASAPQWYLDLL
jgi:hypothetical protein